MRLDLRKLTAFVIIAPADACECLTTRSQLLEHEAFRESYENKSLVARNGQRFVLEFGPGDEFYHAVSERPLWESWMEPCIDRIAEASGDAMALDIGANMGQHAVYLGSKFRRVVAFEPQPLKALQVQRNARANALDNVRVCRCGLAFSRGYAHIFNKDGRNSGRAELIDATNGDKALHDGQGSEKEAPLQRVPLDTLTDFWHRNGQPRIALIKLDAEGFELHIIRGGIEVLRSVRPVVIFEDWGLQWGAGHCANIARMAKYGYQSYLLHGNHDFIAFHQNDTRVKLFGRLVPIQRNCYTELVPGDDRWITKDYWRHQPWFSNYLEERQCARGPESSESRT